MFSLIPVLLIIYIFPIGCSSFDRRCPYPSEWKIRESIVCTSHLEKSYYCLFDDNNKHFTELCRDGPTTAARGYKIEYSGGFEITKCSDARYQPFGFDTEGNSDCIYIKAFCQDEGLVAVEHGDPKTDDQQCACNYTKGYGFVKMPVNKCYCIPSQEDCTCYKQMCNESSILSLDDTCATPYGFNYTQICTSTGITNQKEISLSITTVIDDNTFKSFQGNRKSAMLVLAVIITICLGMILFISIEPTSKMERTVYRSSEGNEVEIICIIDCPCLPLSFVTWRKIGKNGETIDLKDDTSENTVIKGYNGLKLKNVKKTDSGIYSCLVSTIYGNYEFSAEVIIEEMPVLRAIVLFDNTMCITGSFSSKEKPLKIETVSWQKNNESLNSAAIGNDSKYEIRLDYPSLIIRNLNEDDVGTYLCKINNNKDLTCRIEIGMSDVILDTTDYVDRTMRITCLVPSTEKPFTIQKIAWKKINKTHESAEIGTDSKYVMQRDPPSLLIRNIDENDTGKYVCCISCNTEERICSIVIESPTITCEVSQLYELPGKELALKYFIDSDFRVKTNLLKANKGTEVNMLLKEVTHKSINYTIDSASFDDAGTYICRVSNALGTDTASRILVIGDRPEIICERLPYIVPEGHDITLECEVKSKLPLLKLFWERNDVTIDPNDGSGRYKNGNIEVPSLTLNYVSQSDQGNYICYASNVYGIAQSSILEVEIAGPPRITTKCQTYMVYAGDEVNLQCEVASIIPIKKLFWKKNEESVEKTDKYGDATVDFPSLFIKKTEMSDEGDYICCACNDAGMSTSNLIKLIIKDIDLNKTYPPSNDKVKGDHTGADFNNSWHGPYYIGKGNNTGLVAQVALDKFEAKIARERSKKFIDEELRVVLIGKTGAGKSATCNTISGKNLFESKFGAMSITKKTESKRVEVCDKQILLIDTPGIFDYGEIENEKEIEKEISQCVVLGSPGIHAILFVMPLGSRTNESIKVIHTFLEYFGHEMKEHVIVIFTFGDALEKKKMDIKDYLKGAPKDILDFLQQCGNRYVVFNNELESFQNSVQVQCLINLISRHKYEKALCYYTDNIFDAAEKDLKQKEDEIQKKLEDLYQRRVEEFNNAFEKMSERVVTCLKSGVKGDIEKYKRQIEEMQTQSRKEIDELRAKYEDRLSRVRDEARSELKDKPTLFTLRRKSATYDVKK